MSTTIVRTHWTDDTGSPTAPAGNGTQINESELQKIYNAIDTMIAGNVSIGGRLGAEGFGQHLFQSGGTGPNYILIRNTTSGSSNYAQLQVGNNAVTNLGEFSALSSAWSNAGDELIASAVAIRANGAGGLSVAATNSGGTIRFFPNNALATPLLLLKNNEVYVQGSSAPTLYWNHTAASANERQWLAAAAGNLWRLQTISDDHLTTSIVLEIARSTTTPSYFSIATLLRPDIDNTRKCGDTSLRWSEGNFVTLNSGDLGLENKFYWTESYKIERAPGSMPEGVALLNPDGDLIFFIDRDGQICDVHELEWRRTTIEERSGKSDVN